MKQTINSYNQEFGYELLSTVPYAYELHLRGELSGTISGKLSEPLYYFSPNHTINPQPRSWFNTAKARNNGLPYTNIHNHNLQPKQFPKYKEAFANDTHKYSKPTLCICNRANLEWEHSIINYFDETILTWLFENLKDQYHIIYFPINIPETIQDNAPPVTLFDDIALCKKHRINVFDPGDNWNENLLKTFANCEHYITMNGGYSILASYFSGQNIIYSKPGTVETKELKFGSFWRWYPNINNVQTLHVPTYEQLKDKVQALYIDRLPTANVIIRTSGRPHAFARAIGSVLMQTYGNINIVVTVDDRKTNEYTQGYNCRVIPVQPEEIREKKNGQYGYGLPFPSNKYIDQAQKGLNGYIFFLDDDDVFIEPRAIERVISQAKEDSLMIWKTNFPDRIIPNGSFGNKVELYDVTGIGMCYHSSQKHRSDWSPWKCADYRTAENFDKIIWIDEILTSLQSNPGLGLRMDVKQKPDIPMKKTETVKVQFLRNFKEYKAGQVVELAWIIAVNYIYREACKEVKPDPVVEKELKPAYKTKVERTTPKRVKK